MPGDGIAQAHLAAPPELAARRLLLVGTGSLGVSMLPFWLNWLRRNYSDVHVRTVLTRMATRFVSVHALTAIAGAEVLVDEWGDTPLVRGPHVELAEWADAVIVYPATMHFVSKLATGAGDSPATLALQLTSAPVVVVPSLPPGAENGVRLQQNLQHLREHPRFAVAPTAPASSMASDSMDGGLADLPQALALLDTLPGGASRASSEPADAPDRVSAQPSRPGEQELLEDYATGNLGTKVFSGPPGTFRWVHSPGADRIDPFGVPSPELSSQIPSDTPARFVLPVADAVGLSYLTGGRTAAAEWLFRPHPNVLKLVSSAVYAVGQSLRTLHQQAVPPRSAAPSGPARVLRWLAETEQDTTAGALRAAAQRVWGAHRVERLVQFCAEAADAPPRVLLHGSPSLGLIVPPLSAGPTGLLTGLDLAAGCPELDIGWLLGEFLEMREQTRLGSPVSIPHDCRVLADALLTGYGECDSARAARMAAVRFVAHLHDYAAFVGTLSREDLQLGFAAELIDDEGKQALG